MGIFGNKKDKEKSELEEPVASTGKINGLTEIKGRGFIMETRTNESIYFNREGCADFDSLKVGQTVNFMKERDPRDRLRVHAIEVKPA
jgi:cold shock CspA family protein